MRKDLILVAVIVATLALMVVPLSQDIVDTLLALNISLSVLLLVLALYLKRPSDFSTFPSVILIGTAFRLALSIATTRLILSEADAGEIIETFGDFVVRGSVVIGLVIFLIITVVQFLVVTKGAERVAEVAARFALDALPGKQMSIDAEMRNGNLSAEEAATRRTGLDRDSQFFGAMDGAMKFIKGDAIAGLIIISINLLGGIAVGMSMHGYSFGEAASVFSLLTIGDGLVAQIPALLMSLCAGIVVTRGANEDTTDLGNDIFGELVSDPRVPAVASSIVLAVGFIPGFPTATFALFAAIFFISSLLLRRRILGDAVAKELAAAERASAQAKDAGKGRSAAGPADEADANGLDLPVSDRMRLIVGADLGKVLNHDLLERAIAGHFGVLYAARGVRFPRVGFVVSEQIGATDIVVEMDEVPVFRDTARLDCHFVTDVDLVDNSDQTDPDKAYKKIDWPGLRGVWFPKAHEGKLRALDAKPLLLETALGCATYRLYEQNLGTLFSHGIFTELMASAVSEEPEITGLVREEMTEPALFKMFRYLVEDGVPLRPLSLLMSSLNYWIHTAEQPNAVILAECLRGSMKRQLCHRIAGADGILGVVMVDPTVESLARRGIVDSRRNGGDMANEGLAFENDVKEHLLAQFNNLWDAQAKGARPVAIVTAADLRRRLRNFLSANELHFSVLAPHEISSEFLTHPVELISLQGMAKTRVAPEAVRKRPERRTA